MNDRKIFVALLAIVLTVTPGQHAVGDTAALEQVRKKDLKVTLGSIKETKSGFLFASMVPRCGTAGFPIHCCTTSMDLPEYVQTTAASSSSFLRRGTSTCPLALEDVIDLTIEVQNVKRRIQERKNGG